jgi:hypothetical protein
MIASTALILVLAGAAYLLVPGVSALVGAMSRALGGGLLDALLPR